MMLQRKLKHLYTTWYSNEDKLRHKLNELGCTFTERNVMSTFWGVEFKIDKPIGRGCGTKINEINEACKGATLR